MRDLARLVANEVARGLARRQSRTARFVALLPAIPLALIGLLIVVVISVVFAVVSTQNAGGCGLSVPVGAAQNVRTTAAAVQYFESQGITANGAAGIVGNLQQESGLNPRTPGGGLAQWLGSRWTAMVAWVTSHGMDPNSESGQLTYIVYDLRTKYTTLLVELNSASDPATAATMFETVYEVCSGVVGYMKVTSGSLCNDPARRSNAVSALAAAGGGSAASVNLATGGTCIGVGGPGGDPIPGFSPSRDDMGVDACAKQGMPIYAPADSVLVDVVQSWYSGQPLLLFQFNPGLAGTYRGDQYWFVAEQIVPVSEVRGTQFASGQPVAYYAATGTCIEIGWGSPTTGPRTLVPTDAHPPPGALTPEAEAFKTYFHIPWVGRSP